MSTPDSPRYRGAVTRAVGASGEYSGHCGGVEFRLYRPLGEGLVLLVQEGKRWRQMEASTVWDALAIVQRVGARRAA